MTPHELVATLRAKGVRLRARGERIAYEAPPATLTPVYRDALVAMRPQVLDLLRTELLGADWTRVSLWQFDRVLEVAVPWSDLRLVIAPGCRIARELRATDSAPGRIWCACEVLDLLLTGVRPEDARSTAQTRLTFDADLVGVRKEQP